MAPEVIQESRYDGKVSAHPLSNVYVLNHTLLSFWNFAVFLELVAIFFVWFLNLI
jgi:hypothetical protein